MTEALRSILARLGPLIVNEEGAAERERVVREAAEYERRIERKSRLEREHVSLRADVLAAVVTGRAFAEHPTSFEAVIRWLCKPQVPPWLVIRGKPGCGKSVSAAWALANGPGPGCWFGAPALARTFAAGFGPLADAQERALSCALLVIDDLGTEGDASKFQPTLVRLLEARKNTSARTLVTTNLPEAEFARRYSDPRVSSRLGQLAAIVSDTGPDLRLRYPR